MNVVLISNSPNFKSSVSEYFISLVKSAFGSDFNVKTFITGKERFLPENLHDIYDANIILFAFPLYFDGLSSNFMYFLKDIEDYLQNRLQKQNPAKIYAICNCGFYEGVQTKLAITILKNWAVTNGFVWGMGIGVGGGPSSLHFKKRTLGKGFNKNLGNALNILTTKMKEEAKNQDDIFINPNMPRFVYSLAIKQTFNNLAKLNNLSKKDLNKTF